MKKYLKYKDSGIEWIGKIPSRWDLKRLKYRFKFHIGWTPPTGNSEYFSGDNKWVTIADMKARCVSDSEMHISDDAVKKSGLKITPKGSLLYSFKLSVGKVAFAGCDLYTNEAIISVVPNKKDILTFYYYLLPEILICNARENIYDAKLLNQNLIKNSVILAPPQGEEEKIAEYLDCKTAQIDDLISKKEKMIKLLKEEHTAIINHAVTKGLNPNVEMKNSGIEWLGKIPKHWGIKKLKFNASVRFSNVNKKIEEGEESVKLCNYVDVYHNDFISLKLKFMTATASIEEIRKFQLNIGDVIVTKDSESWDDIAVPAYVAETESKLLCGYHLAQIKPDVKILNGKFLFWMLSGNAFNHQYKVESSGVTRYGLSNYALSNSFIVLPPINEQEKINTYLDKKTKQIDEQMEREKKSIELLKEYRTALISEVVTGKIDVRKAVK